MKIKQLKTFALGFIVMATSLVNIANAGIITIDSYDNGWYKSSGEHTLTNTNTYTGCSTNLITCYNSFYNFNIGNQLNNTIIEDITLSFYGANGYYHSDDSEEVIEVWDVNTDVGTLTNSTDAYNDLMSVTQYGEYTLSGNYGSYMSSFSLALNSSSYSDILSNSTFSVGVHMKDVEDNVLWGSSGQSPAAYLTITYSSINVPEPSTLIILAEGIIGLQVNRTKKYN